MKIQRKVKRIKIFKNIITVAFCLALIGAIIFGAIKVNQNFGTNLPSSSEANLSSEVSSVYTEPIPVSSVTISSVGDLLMHMPLINTAEQTDGSFNFDYIFTHIKPYIEKASLGVANLETTLRGTERAWAGYPAFNCPDEIVTAAKTAGFDLLLTANNHSYDTALKGFIRTQEVVRNAGLQNLGTKLSETEKDYLIKEIDGIKFGIVCYTYETDTATDGRKALNGITLSQEATNLITSFSYNKLDRFEESIKTNVQELKEDGADVIISYIHWGNEYQIKESAQQRKVAQILCDQGIDVIIGGHPHVVQPIDLIESENGNKTVCLYSLGNSVSNQRKYRMNLKTGHTEDGLIFNINLTKFSDGKITFDSIDAVPTWVNMYYKDGKNVYEILPLDTKVEDWKTAFSLTDNTLKDAQNSYDRTIDIIGEGLTKVNDFLSGKTNEDATDSSETSSTSDVTSN